VALEIPIKAVLRLLKSPALNQIVGLSLLKGTIAFNLKYNTLELEDGTLHLESDKTLPISTVSSFMTSYGLTWGWQKLMMRQRADAMIKIIRAIEDELLMQRVLTELVIDGRVSTATRSMASGSVKTSQMIDTLNALDAIQLYKNSLEKTDDMLEMLRLAGQLGPKKKLAKFIPSSVESILTVEEIMMLKKTLHYDKETKKIFEGWVKSQDYMGSWLNNIKTLASLLDDYLHNILFKNSPPILQFLSESERRAIQHGNKSLMKEVQAISRANIIKLETDIPKLKLAQKRIAAKAGSKLGRFVSIVGWIDLAIWGITLGADLSLNVFLEEEEQGFFAERWGWSPIDFFIVDPFLDKIFGNIDGEDILREALAQDDLTAGYIIILEWFISELNYEGTLNMDMSGDVESILIKSTTIDPLTILEWGYYAIMVKLIFKYWVLIPLSRLSLFEQPQ